MRRPAPQKRTLSDADDSVGPFDGSTSDVLDEQEASSSSNNGTQFFCRV